MDATTPRLFLLVRWLQDSVALQDLDSEAVAFGVDLTVEGDVVASEEAFKTVGDTEEAEEGLGIKEAEVILGGTVDMVDQTDMVPLQTHPPVQEVAVASVADSLEEEEGMVLAPQIETLPVVGMIRVRAHMMIEMAAFVAAIEVMEIVMGHLAAAAAATWSR